MKALLVISLCTVILLAISFSALAAQHDPPRSALVLVAFGTSYADARVSIDNAFQAAREAFPEVEVRLAFSSRVIRRILLERDGEVIESPMMALARLAEEGFREVVVQPLHILPGIEFHEVVSTVAGFRSMRDNRGRPIFESLQTGEPLLSLEDDYHAVAAALHEDIETYAGEAGHALLLMGHGSPHTSNAAYSKLNNILQDDFGKVVFVGTIDDYPTLDDLIPRLTAQGIHTVTLMPFMLVAGDHAQNDMAGDDDDSWKSILEAEGFSVNTVIKGLGENEQMVAIWIEHADSVLQGVSRMRRKEISED